MRIGSSGRSIIWRPCCQFLRDGHPGNPGAAGVLSRSVLTADDRLVHGNELLTLTDPEYDATAEREYHRYDRCGAQSAR